MIKDVLSGIGGVGVYGVVSISLFFVVFVGMLIRVFAFKRGYLEQMSHLPLEEEAADHVTRKTLSMEREP